MLSASSTASRTANSLAAMSVMKPRLTPRLSRCPVPRTIRRPSSSSRAMMALTLDEPMSRAAISFWSSAWDTCQSALSRGCRSDRLAGRPGQAHNHLSRKTQVEADKAASEEAAVLVEARELHERRLGPILALGKRDSLAGLEVEVPPTTGKPGCRRQLRLQGRHRIHQAAKLLRLRIRARPDKQWKVRHLVDRDAIQD